MTEAERLERLERRQLSNEKSITALTVAVEHIKDTFDRMEKTQEKVSDTLTKLSESIIKNQHLQDDVNELKASEKEKEKNGSTREKSLDKRVGEIEGIIKYVNFKILGALIAAALAVILK